MSMTNLDVFKSLCTNLNQHDSLHIPSPPYQKRRAAVAAIVRWRPHHEHTMSNSKVTSVEEFFQQPWVDGQGEAEILFMQRTTRVGDRWSGHVSFVGGKNEPGETDEETVKREVWEEIGIDLNNADNYIQLGKLNEREISSVKDNKLLMVLIPFVYLQIVPESPQFKLQESEVAAVQWVPLSFFLSTEPYPYRPMTEKLNIVKLKQNKWITPLIRMMMGSVTFPAIDLPTSPEVKTIFRLWGLTMGMTRDIIKFTHPNNNNLAFLKLVNSKPVYSRPDIGWLTTLVTYITWTSRKIMSSTSALDNQRSDKELWDKIYFESIRKGIMVALIARLGVASLALHFIIRKLIHRIK